jgi:phospholipase C
MPLSGLRRLACFALPAIILGGIGSACAEGNLKKVKHIIIIMQENHSFDNYFGALAYAPGSPYHTPSQDRDRDQGNDASGCPKGDHRCVDGLTCTVSGSGQFTCLNSNIDDNGHTVLAFHDSRRCVAPDLDHGWGGTHHEANFSNPNNTLHDALNDGFVRVNDVTEQPDQGVENATEDQTMNFYNQDEIPFYYDLAEKFAVNDRYFCSVLGPTFPNRSYLMAATSFGHLTTAEIFPPAGGYKPITGTIFDLMEANNVSWADYFQDLPQAGSFRPITDSHFLPLPTFLSQASGHGAPLPAVSFVDPAFVGAPFFPGILENDEHPPTDIQRGQAYVFEVVNAVRKGPFWKDSIIFITYDEHGGSYDHVRPPRARQGHQPNPDGISPGQCADLSNPPASFEPGGGAECKASKGGAIGLCPALGANPTGPFPAACANFDQLGIRVPFLAISPFSKRHYVSHTVGDHTSLLALIEKRFMTSDDSRDSEDTRPHLTLRDQHANTLEDMFDFDESPSLNTKIGNAAPPAEDCTPR